MQEPSIESMKQHVRDVEEDTKRLREVVEKVTAELASRTSRAAQITVSHAATTDRLSGMAVEAMGQLNETSQIFLSDIDKLKSSFDVLKVMAQKTAEVRKQVTGLETQVLKLAAKHSADAARSSR